MRSQRSLLISCAALLAAVLLSPLSTRAAGIVNGFFEGADLSGWSLDTDGAAGGAPDFEACNRYSQCGARVGGSGQYAARIQADAYATPGDIASAPQTAVFIANTLSQGLDTSVLAGERLYLAFEWAFDGDDGGSGNETFAVGLVDPTGQWHGADGMPGYVVVPQAAYGDGSFGVELDEASFANQPGWSIAFQVMVGVDPAEYEPNAERSFLLLDNVRLTALPEPTPTPALLCGVALLALLEPLRRHARGRGRGARLVRSAVVLCLLAILLPQAGRASAWSDVSPSAALTTPAKAFDPQGGVLFSLAGVENTSGGALAADLRLVVTSSNLQVVNADGITDAGEPFFDLPAGLAVDESRSVRIDFARVRGPLAYTTRLEQLLPPAAALQITSGPTATLDPNGVTPLAAVVEATTSVAARATLHVTGPSESWDVSFLEYQTDHYLPVLRLEPDTSYTVDVDFTDSLANQVSASGLQVVTAPLPADFPMIDVLVSQPALMEPGFLLVDRARNGPQQLYSTIWDADGDLVWYSPIGGNAMIQRPDGRLFFRSANLTYTEMDMLGVQTSSPTFQSLNLHHDFQPTPHGTFVGLSNELFTAPSYPTDQNDPNAPPAAQDVRDQPPQEFRPDGTLLNSWPLRNLLDTTRIAYNGLQGCGTAVGCDWIHDNAVLVDPSDDSVIVSMRHQDAVIKISRADGKLKWILGTHANWSAPFQPFLLAPQGATEWQYHQHAPAITPNGLLMFDNGNFRASPFDGTTPESDLESGSRAVEFAIDEENMEVEQIWEFRFPVVDRVFSSAISDADWMPQTGNVLVDFGSTIQMGGSLTGDLGLGTALTRLVEVTHEAPAQIVYDMMIYEPTGAIRAFRAEKIPSLYPSNVTVTGP